MVIYTLRIGRRGSIVFQVRDYGLSERHVPDFTTIVFKYASGFDLSDFTLHKTGEQKQSCWASDWGCLFMIPAIERVQRVEDMFF